MHQVTFNVETLTPLFLAGAEQSQAELRAPSFRGLMRYWLRALVGGAEGTDVRGLEKVMKTEAEVFGSTNTGSSVAIKVSGASHEAKPFTEPISVRVGGRWQATGKGYLLWSMAKSGREERKNVKPARWYFQSGTSFKVTLLARGEDETRLKQAVAAFWLLTHLGGIGSRSRRCAGSLAVQPTESYNLPFSIPATVAELRDQLQDGIKEARKLYYLTPRPMKAAQFDVLAPEACRIWILQDERPWPTPDIAMKRLGEELQEYRQPIPIVKRKIFGLPLPPAFFRERRASPLLLRVARLQGNRYVGIAVLFKTTGKGIFTEDYTLIERWIDGFSGKLEVKL